MAKDKTFRVLKPFTHDRYYRVNESIVLNNEKLITKLTTSKHIE